MPERSYLTVGEFGRHMAALQAQLKGNHDDVKEELREIKATVRATNGKTAENCSEIAMIKREVQALVATDLELAEKVESVEKTGCAQYAAHSSMLQEMAGIQLWSPKRKVAAAGGLLGAGALMWPALQEIAKLFHALLDKLPG